jgi:hypothetical protein
MTRSLLRVAAILMISAVPARAGSVVYAFIEASTAPHPGQAGAILTFASPPALPDAGWTASSTADILAFQVIDSAIAPAGFYTPDLAATVVSSTGAMLDAGSIIGGLNHIAIQTAIDSGPGQSLIVNLQVGTGVGGDWSLALGQAVPEPSSLFMAGTAAAVGLAVASRRRSSRHAGRSGRIGDGSIETG